MTLTREQVDEWREMLIDPAPWASEKQRVEAVNTLCDAALAGMREGWIPVSERLPEKGSFVWAWDAERGANPSALLADGLWVITYDDAEISPTHWMPLPEPPARKDAK